MPPDDDTTQTHVTLASGTMVSHYRIIEKIGAGGMGEVYLAEDTQLDRKVALKFLPPHLCQDEDCRARFKREAQAAAKLDHPNIVTVHEVGEHQGRPYFAMQHLEGRSLREVIQGEKLDLDRIVGIAIQLSDGLNKAHRSGTIHRDVKPSNIMIDSNGRPRLLDFGLATVKGGEHLTKTGSTLGTVGYMSPEQIEGKEADARSDLFSLGVVLYELIAGRAPFRRDDETATLKAILADTPEPLARYKTNVSDDLQRIVTKLLDKDPALRYQSAADVISDLKRLGTKDGAKTRKPFWQSTLNKFLIGFTIGVTLFVLKELFWPKADDTGADRKMLAVLPFENLGNPEDEYFADGMTEEITTSLARLSGLGVISRTSAIQYKNTEKSLKEIGKELNVDYVLEGTIRWDKSSGESRVRINPQLIRVSDDLHMWADRYDAVLTDVFDVQSTIAQEVAAALDVTLLQAEQLALGDRADVDPAAYDYYLRGKQYFSIARYEEPGMRLAEMMHLKAIELAPDFAPAYAELGSIYTEMYWDLTDPSSQRLDSAKRMVNIAMRLAPNAPETHQALGWYYYHGLRDYEHALGEFAKVLELQPNNALAIASTAWVQRRQGKWEEAIAGLRLAIRLDPREPWYRYELALTYLYCRRYQDAIAQFDRVIDLQPDHEWAYFIKSWTTLNLTGDTREARRVLDEGQGSIGGSPPLTWLEVYYDLMDGQYDHALGLMLVPGDVYFPENPDSLDYYYMKGLTYSLMRQRGVATTYFDSARVLLESKLAATPDAVPYLGGLARVYAGLGRRDDAIGMARRNAELVPLSTDALSGSDNLIDLAMIYAQVGEPNQAVELFDSLLAMPGRVSTITLRLMPEIAPLRDHPRFQALLAKYDKEYGN